MLFSTIFLKALFNWDIIYLTSSTLNPSGLFLNSWSKSPSHSSIIILKLLFDLKSLYKITEFSQLHFFMHSNSLKKALNK